MKPHQEGSWYSDSYGNIILLDKEYQRVAETKIGTLELYEVEQCL